MSSRIKKLGRFCVILAITVFAAELVSRLDDWAFQDVPVFSNPYRERDLLVHDEKGLHGRPGGAFKKWRLNSLGFRGPELRDDPSPQDVRIAILGASETFGLYESAGHDYPSLLGNKLAASYPRLEIVNVAVAGMTLPTQRQYWNNWVKEKAKPKVVVIYPSPLFYLDDEAPGEARIQPRDVAVPLYAKSRFCDRLVDLVRKTDLVRRARSHWNISRGLADKGPDFVWTAVPEDRVAKFRADLERLVQDIAESGARPVLVTHAMKATDPPEPEHLRDLQAMRVFFLRAEPAVMTRMEARAAEVTRDVARAKGIALIDAAKWLDARQRPRDLEWFADLTHFTDAGAARLAELLATELPPLVADHGKGTPP